MTIEEPKTTDAESVASTPEATGAATETVTAEAAAAEAESVAATSEDGSELGATPQEAAVAPTAEAALETGSQADSPSAESAASDEAGTAERGSGSVEAEPAPEGDVPSDAVADVDQDALGAPAGTEPEAAAEAEPAAEPAADVAVAPAEAGAESVAAPAPASDRPEPTTMAELLAEQSGDIPSLKHGDVVEGTIVRIDKDEMLVDVGAKSEGVVSNRELYGRNTETQPDLSVGDTVLVYVLQPESSDGHAVLSLRRAGLERKWRSMQDQFDEGVIIEAPVIDHNKGGLIVDCGIRGFVPISQIVDFPRRPQNDQPRDAAQEIAEKLQPYVGRKLRLKILEVNRKANRLILSEKVALYEERREKRDELFSSLQVGEKVKGTVRSIAPFGIFIDLGGIDGLVHKSELSWNKVNNPEGAYEVGDEVEAEVIDINHERGRISLSIRRLLPDPWQSTVADLKVADIVDGTVTKIVNFGAFVRVKDGLEGLIHISELSHQRVAHPGDVVHEGQTLKLKVISLDSERHRLGLSLKQAEEAPARAPRERRARPERGGYDRSQAIQEPEGGIDNTLAAAFAQVRQQIAEQDAAATTTDETAEAAIETAEVEAEVPAAAEVEAEVPAAAETAEAEAETAEAAIEAPEAETVEAPAPDAEAAPVEAQVEAPAPDADTAAPEDTPAAEEAAESAVEEAATEAQASDTPPEVEPEASEPAAAEAPEAEAAPAEAEAEDGSDEARA